MSKISKNLQTTYREKYTNAVEKNKAARIGKGIFSNPDPTTWLEEIQDTTSDEDLKKKVEAYNKYIDIRDEQYREKARGVLNGAISRALANKDPEFIANKFIDEIYKEQNPKTYENNQERYIKDLEAAAKKSGKDAGEYIRKVRNAAEVRKIVEETFPNQKPEEVAGSGGLQRLNQDVLDAYKESDEKGDAARNAYERLAKTIFDEKVAGAYIQGLEKYLNNRLNPAKKSLSVRDLFRARNPDWE